MPPPPSLSRIRYWETVSRSWQLNIEGVDFLAAAVADRERRVIRRKAVPTAEDAARSSQLPRACYQSNLVVGQADTINAGHRGGRWGRDIVDGLRVSRPLDKPHLRDTEVAPFLRLHVIQHQLGFGVGGQGDDVPSVGRPPRGKQVLRTRQRRDLVGLEIEKVNLASRCIGAAENQGTPGGRPAWIELVFARGCEWLGHAGLDRGDVKVPRLAEFSHGVRDLLAVRRPAWNRCDKGRIS